ncbi:MAG: UDP-N-acetylglucosamine 1-carboxyvinyltransferase [Candidatus Nealsonbacteria bacterium]|nr:UDP-N-acetylglucosamine 1-carboxyvinyltransferase [Candidatus Nealsonbacteria bacterium]
MAEKFLINGGKKLEGEIEVRGAKNAAFGILAASLLTKGECVIDNLPLIEDLFRMVEILKGMGVKIDWVGERTLKINAESFNPSKINHDLVTIFRGSVLLVGPILARFGKVKIAHPGGCVIGARPITTHLDAFSQMGVEIKYENGGILSFELKEKARDRTVVLNEFSVTATENAVLLASSFPARTTIKIADADYQIQELSKFLNKMGAKINGAGTHTIEVVGSPKLSGVKHKLIYDPIEAGTFIIAAVATKGNVLVKNVEVSFLDFFLKKLKDFGAQYQVLGKDSIKVLPYKNLFIDKIQSLPYPGLPSDLQSSFGVLSTQTKGSTLIHDPLYEGRLKYLEEVNKMGAEIYFADPHRAIVNGPTELQGRELGNYDLRGGAALIIAGLIARGQTSISNIYQIDRGYEKIEERLQKLGADIKRVKN